jgi:hypothetical protein
MLIVVSGLELKGAPQFMFTGAFVRNVSITFINCSISSTGNVVAVLASGGPAGLVANVTVAVDSTTITAVTAAAGEVHIFRFSGALSYSATALLISNANISVTSLGFCNLAFFERNHSGLTVSVQNSIISVRSENFSHRIIRVNSSLATYTVTNVNITVRNCSFVMAALASSTVLYVTGSRIMGLNVHFYLSTITVFECSKNSDLSLVHFELPTTVSEDLTIVVMHSTWSILPVAVGQHFVLVRGASAFSHLQRLVFLAKSATFNQTAPAVVTRETVSLSRCLFVTNTDVSGALVMFDSARITNIRNGVLFNKARGLVGLLNVTIIISRSAFDTMILGAGIADGSVLSDARLVVQDSTLTNSYGGPVFHLASFFGGIVGNFFFSLARSSCITPNTVRHGELGVPSCINVQDIESMVNFTLMFVEATVFTAKGPEGSNPFSNAGFSFVRGAVGIQIYVLRSRFTLELSTAGFVFAVTNINIYDSSNVSNVIMWIEDSFTNITQGGSAQIFTAATYLFDRILPLINTSVTVRNTSTTISAVCALVFSIQASDCTVLRLTVLDSRFELKMLWPPNPVLASKRPFTNFYGMGFMSFRSSTSSSIQKDPPPTYIQIVSDMPIPTFVNASGVTRGAVVVVDSSIVTMNPSTLAMSAPIFALAENSTLSNVSITLRNSFVRAWSAVWLDNTTATNIHVTLDNVSWEDGQALFQAQSLVPRPLRNMTFQSSAIGILSSPWFFIVIRVLDNIALDASSIAVGSISIAESTGAWAVYHVEGQQCSISDSILAVSDSLLSFNFPILKTGASSQFSCFMRNSLINATGISFPSSLARGTLAPALFEVVYADRMTNVTVLLHRNVIWGFEGVLLPLGDFYDFSLKLKVMCNFWNGKWLTSGQLASIPATSLELKGDNAGVGAFPFNRPRCPTTPRESLTATAQTTETATLSASLRGAKAAPARLGPLMTSSVAATVLLSAVLPGSAGAVQRAQTVAALALCEPSFDDSLDVFSSPTQLWIAPRRGGYVRGAVIGNVLLIWGGAAALGVLVGALLPKTKSSETLWQRLGALSRLGDAVLYACCAHSVVRPDSFDQRRLDRH